jgi:hypothetical protein
MIFGSPKDLGPETTAKLSHFLTQKLAETTEKTVATPSQMSGLNSQSESNKSAPANSAASNGGICSVLLEVIEKIRDSETSSTTATSNNSNKRRSSQSVDQAAAATMPEETKRCKSNNTSGSKQKRINLAEFKPCVIETSVVSSLFEDEDELINKFLQNNSESPNPNVQSGSNLVQQQHQLQASPKYLEMLKLLELLANNDGNEQYQCGLCSYVCFHLPSLKSHMWTHVKSEKFDYSRNTSIVNAAIDYENKLNRSLSSINALLASSSAASSSDTDSTASSDASLSSCMEAVVEKKLHTIMDQLNLGELKRRLTADSYNEERMSGDDTAGMVSFRCSKCFFQSTDLCVLRLHKRQQHCLPPNDATLVNLMMV